MSCFHRSIVWAVLLAAPLGCAASTTSSSHPAPQAPKNLAVGEQSGSDFTATRSNAATDTSMLDSEARLAKEKADEEASAPQAPPPPCAVHSEAVPGGIALIFDARTTPAQEIQKHARQVAQTIERLRKHGQTAPDPATFGLRQIAALDPQVAAIPSRDGARIVLTTSEPSLVEALRAEVIWHTADLMPDLLRDRKSCPAVPRETAGLQ